MEKKEKSFSLLLATVCIILFLILAVSTASTSTTQIGSPSANFTCNVSQGYAPLTVQFNDSSVNATEWNWDFGDGSNSTVQSPEHTYLSAGNYTVNLTVNNANGTNSTLSTINVTEKPTPVPPVADFCSDVTSGEAPLSVQFTDLSQNATSRVWDFGDGYNTTDKNPEHTYNEIGTYTVTLRVSNEVGSDTKTGIITVGSGSIDSIDNGQTTTNNENSTNTNNNTKINTCINSTNNETSNSGTTSTNNETNNTTCTNSVDNRTSSIHNETNTSNTCTNSNDNGTPSNTVSSCSNLIADFSTFINDDNIPLNVRFIDESMGNPVSWDWNFGDGRTSPCKNATHVYSKAGTYTVTVTITDAEGNKATKSENILVDDSTQCEASTPSSSSQSTSTNATTPTPSPTPVVTQTPSPTPTPTPTPIPTVTPTPEPTPVPTPTPTVTSTPSSSVIASWTGSTNKNTETFHVPSGEWKISWVTNPGQSGAMNFIITVYNADGSYKDLAANVIGASTDSTIERGAGDYYLTINTAQPYTITVEQV